VAGPDDNLILINGTDILFELDTWYHPERIVRQAELLLARRPGVLQESTLRKATELEEKFGIEISYFPIEGVNISSREIRRTGDYSKLAAPVRQFIARHDLYPKENPLVFLKDETHALLFEYETKLFGDLSRERLLHSLNTVDPLRPVMPCFGISPDEAAVAGLLHDSAKQLPIAGAGRDSQKGHGRAVFPTILFLHAPGRSDLCGRAERNRDESDLSAIRPYRPAARTRQHSRKSYTLPTSSNLPGI
jgi:nicotinate-nucleotide adenylyltransferase